MCVGERRVIVFLRFNQSSLWIRTVHSLWFLLTEEHRFITYRSYRFSRYYCVW